MRTLMTATRAWIKYASAVWTFPSSSLQCHVFAKMRLEILSSVGSLMLP